MAENLARLIDTTQVTLLVYDQYQPLFILPMGRKGRFPQVFRRFKTGELDRWLLAAFALWLVELRLGRERRRVPLARCRAAQD